MGVYIPDMEIPKGELGSVPVVIFADGVICHFFTQEKLGNAIAVPDHGDLIDKAELLKMIEKAKQDDPDIADVYEDDYMAVKEWLDAAPVVIQASGGNR